MRRRIQSYVRREGRLTPAQRRALESLWPHYGLSTKSPFEPEKAFTQTAPLIVEIGFGNGESLLEMASSYPHYNYLGIEVHRPGVGHLLLALDKMKLTNVRLYCEDAVEVLEKQIGDSALHRVNIFFPDPWPKKRHHKRRLIQPQFVSLLARKLEAGGILHLATDWPDYAVAMIEAVGTSEDLCSAGQLLPSPPRPTTKYQRRGQRLGHPVTDLIYIKHRSKAGLL